MEIEIAYLYQLLESLRTWFIAAIFISMLCCFITFFVVVHIKRELAWKAGRSVFQEPDLFGAQLAFFREVLQHKMGYWSARVFVVNLMIILVVLIYSALCQYLVFQKMEGYLMDYSELKIFVDDLEVSFDDRDYIANRLLRAKSSKFSGSRDASGLIKLRLEVSGGEKLHFRVLKDSRDSDLYWVSFTDEGYRSSFTTRYAKMESAVVNRLRGIP